MDVSCPALRRYSWLLLLLIGSWFHVFISHIWLWHYHNSLPQFSLTHYNILQSLLNDWRREGHLRAEKDQLILRTINLYSCMVFHKLKNLGEIMLHRPVVASFNVMLVIFGWFVFCWFFNFCGMLVCVVLEYAHAIVKRFFIS